MGDLKITTLRSHLAAIFLKTGTENQRELVRMLNRLPQVRLHRVGASVRRYWAPSDPVRNARRGCADQ